MEDVNYQIQEDESIDFEYTCSVVGKTKFCKQDTFANSLIFYYRYPEILEEINKDRSESGVIVLFEDGSIIPNAAINEIKGVLDQLTGVISWQAGDLVMIDNSRFLHGRRAFQDTRRQIFSHLSYLKS